MKGNIRWIIIFAATIFICALWIFLSGTANKSGLLAVIRLDGEIIRTVNLRDVQEPYEFTLENGGGYNTIRVENGRIAVIDADCPDKVCVSRGYISNGVLPIVCLPHRLTVTVTGAEDGYDAVAGGN